jgi:hypothetical protein
MTCIRHAWSINGPSGGERYEKNYFYIDVMCGNGIYDGLQQYDWFETGSNSG